MGHWSGGGRERVRAPEGGGRVMVRVRVRVRVKVRIQPVTSRYHPTEPAGVRDGKNPVMDRTFINDSSLSHDHKGGVSED